MSVIEFNHVSKSYRLGASRTSLREAITGIPRKILRRGSSQASDADLFWALNDVSFHVDQGEVLGIIGHNGAGKSTSLKLLSKVTFPTSGSIQTKGRMAALIELGAGFHPDLSGRENIYLNGSILGLKRREIDAQFDSMVEFSGLEKFIDTPVKRYSSGMYVRLAFATAAHVKADLLLVDEVLSVGDSAFQQKCLTKMQELRDSGATIVFVSHNIWSIESFCRRVILMNHGKIESEGAPHSVIELYRRQQREMMLVKASNVDDVLNGGTSKGGDTVITQVEMLDKDGQPGDHFDAEGGMRVRVHYSSPRCIERPAFMIEIRRADSVACCQLRDPYEEVVPIQGDGVIEAYINPLQLLPDIYTMSVRIIDRRQPIVHAVANAGSFHINGYVGGETSVGVFTPYTQWSHTAWENNTQTAVALHQ